MSKGKVKIHCSSLSFPQPFRMKKLEFMDSSRLAGLESDLKLKNFELQRSSLLLSETEGKWRNLEIEKEKLVEKLDVRIGFKTLKP